MNPSDHIGDIMDADADAREEMDILIRAEECGEKPCLDANDVAVFDGVPDVEYDDGFDLSGDDFDPSGGLTEDDFPVVEDDDYDYDEDGGLEATAEAYHSQWD